VSAAVRHRRGRPCSKVSHPKDAWAQGAAASGCRADGFRNAGPWPVLQENHGLCFHAPSTPAPGAGAQRRRPAILDSEIPPATCRSLLLPRSSELSEQGLARHRRACLVGAMTNGFIAQTKILPVGNTAGKDEKRKRGLADRSQFQRDKPAGDPRHRKRNPRTIKAPHPPPRASPRLVIKDCLLHFQDRAAIKSFINKEIDTAINPNPRSLLNSRFAFHMPIAAKKHAAAQNGQ